MKYLVLGLILIASVAGHAPAETPAPMRASASVQFAVSSADIETRVGVDIHEASGAARLGLSIHRNRRSCAGAVCQTVPLISGFAYQDARPIDTYFDRYHNHASVHATFLVHDDVSNADLPVRVDVVWTATGLPRCDDLRDEVWCFRDVSAVGEVAAGPLRLIPAQTVLDGRFAWYQWSLPTYNSFGP
jgi:hypothetical protein